MHVSKVCNMVSGDSLCCSSTLLAKAKPLHQMVLEPSPKSQVTPKSRLTPHSRKVLNYTSSEEEYEEVSACVRALYTF